MNNSVLCPLNEFSVWGFQCSFRGGLAIYSCHVQMVNCHPAENALNWIELILWMTILLFFFHFHSVWRNSQFFVSHASLPRSGNSAKLHVCLKWVSISYSGKKQTICKPCLFTKKWKQFKAPCLKWVSISHSGTWSGSCLIQYPLFSRAIEVLIYSLGLTQWKATWHEYILVDKSICLL